MRCGETPQLRQRADPDMCGSGRGARGVHLPPPGTVSGPAPRRPPCLGVGALPLLAPGGSPGSVRLPLGTFLSPALHRSSVLQALSAAACKSFPPTPPGVASLPQASPHLHLLKTRLPVCTAAGEERGEIRAPGSPRMQPGTCSRSLQAWGPCACP